MNTSKATVVANAALGKIASIIGWVFGSFMFALTISFIFDGDDTAIFTLVLLAGCVFLIIKGAKIKKRIKRFKKYVYSISVENMTSLNDLAESTHQSVDYVRNDLQDMISRKFFANASIDMATNKIVVGCRNISTTFQHSAQPVSQTEYETFNCTGCGALGTKLKGTQGSCEYCGSPL